MNDNSRQRAPGAEREQLARDLDGADQAGLGMMDEIAELRAEVEQLRAILRDEPDGTPRAIIGGMFDAAEARGHSPYAARHAMAFLLDRHDTLAAALADLRALLAPLWPLVDAATPIGEWEVSTRDDAKHQARQNGIVVRFPGVKWGARHLVITANAQERHGRLDDYWVQAKRGDLDLIVTAINALPALRRLVEGRT